MIDSLSKKHPLFDPASGYNRMRATIHFAQDKMRGYWDWLCVQQNRSQEPLPPTEARSERELCELSSRLAAEGDAKCSVLHALRAQGWVMAEAIRQSDGQAEMRSVPITAEVLLLREQDGTLSLGLLLEGQPQECFARARRCRAF